MAGEHYVVIGNGPAGNEAADVLRAGAPDARVTIISDEFFPYYYRHRLRDFIVGGCEEGDLVVRAPSHYREHDIRLRLGQKVTRVEPASQTLFLAHMEKIQYTKLLICCGGMPRVPEVHYTYRQHLSVLSTLRHARMLRARMPDLRRVVMCGGDMISFRVATTLAAVGKEVVFLIDEEAFWPLELTDDLRAEFSSALGRKGIEVREGDALTGVDAVGDDRYVARTRGGAAIDCDLVGAFFGFVPAIEFLRRSGLDIERGLLVNERLQTSQQGVYAAGDCAEIYRPDLRNYWVSIGWPNALQLGALAARNMLGEAVDAGGPAESVFEVEGVRVNTSWWREF
jgi:nitrite reductase (NADH) large subunit